MTTYMYVSLGGENTILHFILAPVSGALEAQGGIQVGTPQPLVVDRKNEYIYAGLREDSAIGTFRINPGSGDLSLAGKISVDTNPGYLFVDHTGKYLLSAFYFAGKVQVFAISEKGQLNATPICVQTTQEHAHWIQTDSSNRYVFVPHTMPANAIYQFTWDENSGQLSPNAKSQVSIDDGLGPRHLEFHPMQDLVYSSNENSSTITAYNLNTFEGTLEAFQTLSTLPDGYDGESKTAQIHIHPSGKFIYVSNRGHDSIARFAIDEETGDLTSLGQTPTEATPRAFNIDPSGSILVAAGQDSGRLASYRIDLESGNLDPLDVIQVGERPSWVLFVELG